MSKQYKGRGFFQQTGKITMPNSLSSISLQPLTINSSNVSSWSQYNATASQGYSASFDFNSLMNNSHLKKYEMYESTEDVMALAVTANRMMRNDKIHYKLTDSELYRKVEQSDRDKAQEIRDYYSKKVMMLKLKGNGKMSSFREDLNKLVHSDGLIYKESMIGVAYWLPTFYEYDLDLDTIKSGLDTNQNFEALDKRNVPNVKKLTVDLSPIKRIKRVSKRSKFFEYWMKDSDLNAGVVLILEEKNQLQHLWDYIFERESTIKIKGNYVRKHRDGFEYYSINNWELDRG
jgi:hypothetical protein